MSAQEIVSVFPVSAHSLHYPGVDVAKLLEAEQAGAMGRVIEDEALPYLSALFFCEL